MDHHYPPPLFNDWHCPNPGRTATFGSNPLVAPRNFRFFVLRIAFFFGCSDRTFGGVWGWLDRTFSLTSGQTAVFVTLWEWGKSAGLKLTQVRLRPPFFDGRFCSMSTSTSLRKINFWINFATFEILGQFFYEGFKPQDRIPLF